MMPDNITGNFHGKVIFVTGASSGIGRECCVLLSHLGATLILVARNEINLNATKELMSPGNHIIVPADMINFDTLGNVVKEAVQKAGKIHGFVHSAGIETTVPLRNMSIAIYNQLFSVNLFAGLELAKTISQKGNYEDGCSLVFISSVMGFLGQAGKVGYCATKGALLSAVKAMALELAAKKIRVNAVSPGLVATEMTLKMLEQLGEENVKKIEAMHPLGIGRPGDVANVVMFLLSDLSRWMTGNNLVIDGGYSAQ